MASRGLRGLCVAAVVFNLWLPASAQQDGSSAGADEELDFLSDDSSAPPPSAEAAPAKTAPAPAAAETSPPSPVVDTVPVAAAPAPVPKAAPAKRSERSIEEIVVTARRVEESLQETPLSITALSGEQLKAAGVTEVGDLAVSTPSVQVAPTTGRKTAASFAIRGQKASDVVIVNDPSVGVYLAEVPLMRPYGIAAMGLLDIQSVQVLKGPQGTLFGRNTTGGAVLITPSEPSDHLEGSASAGFGDYSSRELEGILNLPVADTLALRFAVGYSDQDGLIGNRSGSTATVPLTVQMLSPDDRYRKGLGRDFGEGDMLAYRASLRWQPSERLKSVVYLDGAEFSSTGTGVTVRAVDPTGLADVLYSGAFSQAQREQQAARFYSAQSGVGNYSELSVFGVANISSFQVSDSFTIKNILGYRSVDNQDLTDVDGVASAAAIDTEQLSVVDQISEEFQLVGSAFDDRLNWIAGLFYFTESGEDSSEGVLLSGAAGGAVNVFRIPSRTGASDAQNLSYSAFTQGTWSFTDALNLTLGLRFTRDEREVTSQASQGDPTLPEAHPNGQLCNLEDDNGVPRSREDCSITLKKTFSEPTWNVSLDYRLSDTHLIYGAHRHGYRSGGFNSQIDSAAQRKPFESETVDDVELGYKADLTLAGSPLRLNLATYFADYRNIQRLLVDPSLTRFIVNAASATITGGELEMTWLPLDGLTLSGYYSMQRARYEKFTGLSGEDLSDNRFAAIPDHQGGFTLRLQRSLDELEGELALQANVYAQSETEMWDETQPGTHQGGHTLYSGRLEWNRISGSAFSAALWGKNLGNKQYYVGSLGLYNLFGFTNGYLGEPRTVGLELSYRFGE